MDVDANKIYSEDDSNKEIMGCHSHMLGRDVTTGNILYPVKILLCCLFKY